MDCEDPEPFLIQSTDVVYRMVIGFYGQNRECRM